MNIKTQPYHSFQIDRVGPEFSQKDLEFASRYSSLVEIFVKDPYSEDHLIVEGKKINIEELHQTLPYLPINQLALFDENKDGFIEETELFLTTSDYIEQEFDPKSSMAVGAISGALWGNIVPIAGAPIGAAMGAILGLVGGATLSVIEYHEDGPVYKSSLPIDNRIKAIY